MLSFKYILRSGVAGSHDNSMFNHLRNCQTAFKSACTILHSHQQCVRVPISPHPHQHLLLSDYFYYTHTTGFEVVSLRLWFARGWASFHAFIGSLYIFFGEMSMPILCPFFNELFVSSYWVVRVLIYFGSKLLIASIICKYFFHSMDYLFTSLIVSFDTQSF